MRVLIIFVVLVLAEIYVLAEVGSSVGGVATVALVVLTAALGAALMRMQGIMALHRARVALAQGEPPTLELLEGAVILVAGASLLVPGFITDAAGFLCLIPPVRRAMIERAIASRFERTHGTPPPSSPFADDADHPSRPRIIEGDWRRVDDSDSDPRP